MSRLEVRLKTLSPETLRTLQRGLEKESLRAHARWHAGARSASGRPGFRTDPSPHHDRLQRIAGRTDHRRAPGCRGVPAAADGGPPGGLPRRSATRCSGAPACRANCRPRTRSRSAGTARPTSAAPRPSTATACGTATAAGCRRSPACTTTSPCRSASWPALQQADGFEGTADRPSQCHLFLADPQLPPHLLAAALPVRCLAGRLPLLRRRPRAPPPGVERHHPLPAVCHLVADGAARLPERRPVVPGRELQLPAQLRAVAADGADPALSAVRGDRHPARRRVPAAQHHAAADRERVLRHDPPEAADPPRRTAAACAGRARRRIRRGPADGPRSRSARSGSRRRRSASSTSSCCIARWTTAPPTAPP